MKNDSARSQGSAILQKDRDTTSTGLSWHQGLYRRVDQVQRFLQNKYPEVDIGADDTVPCEFKKESQDLVIRRILAVRGLLLGMTMIKGELMTQSPRFKKTCFDFRTQISKNTYDGLTVSIRSQALSRLRLRSQHFMIDGWIPYLALSIGGHHASHLFSCIRRGHSERRKQENFLAGHQFL